MCIVRMHLILQYLCGFLFTAHCLQRGLPAVQRRHESNYSKDTPYVVDDVILYGRVRAEFPWYGRPPL